MNSLTCREYEILTQLEPLLSNSKIRYLIVRFCKKAISEHQLQHNSLFEILWKHQYKVSILTTKYLSFLNILYCSKLNENLAENKLITSYNIHSILNSLSDDQVLPLIYPVNPEDYLVFLHSKNRLGYSRLFSVSIPSSCRLS